MMDPITGAVVIAGLKYVGKPSAELVTDFLGRVFAPTGDALGTGVAQPIVDWQKRRVERANKLILNAAAEVERLGEEPQVVPGRVLMPLLEKGSLEEDDNLQATWARLLAKAAAAPNEVSPAFVSILAELTPEEAKILEWVYQTAEARENGRIDGEEVDLWLYWEPAAKPSNPRWERVSERHWMIEDNFIRLRLMEMPPLTVSSSSFRSALSDHMRSPDPSTGLDVERDEFGRLLISTLGAAFMKACMGTTKPTQQLPERRP
jgi:hypothetical protein